MGESSTEDQSTRGEGGALGKKKGWGGFFTGPEKKVMKRVHGERRPFWASLQENIS